MTDWANDLRAISDFCDGSPEVPSNVTAIRKKNFKPSLYDFDYSDDDTDIELNDFKGATDEVENLPYPKYRIGRGYLIQKGLQNRCVGGIVTDTTQSIRSVSNIDYSNHNFEQTFRTHNGTTLNAGSSTASVEKGVINEKPKQEISALPLSEILKNCRKPQKFAKLNTLNTFINNNGASTLNFNGETHTRDLKSDCAISFDLLSPVEFPSLS